MGTKKLNFSEMKNALSRSEMKNIMAGSGGDKCNVFCKNNSDCDPAGGSCTSCADGGNAGGKLCQRP